MKPTQWTSLVGLMALMFWAIPNPTFAAPSFDCAKASSRVEKLICARPGLAQLDSDLADAYRTALRDVSWSSANRRIRAEQKDWIARRNQCQNAKCLRRLYHSRIGALYSELDDSEPAAPAAGPNPGEMMAQCRERAAGIFHIRLHNVETKYEGQRTDGTHAVNGTAYLRQGSDTFQCSFDAAGSAIVQFIVN
ncbi:MAG: lysozyme inhibitor LprI family protein [Rhizobiaceae bacterium]